MSLVSIDNNESLRLYRSVAPSHVFVSLPKEALCAVHTLGEIFTEKYSPSSENLLVKFSFSESKILLIDPKADDLEACHRIFMQVTLGSQDSIFLEELAAPSFSGKKAMQLFWKIKGLTHSSTALWVDGSEVLPCCCAGYSVSLKASEVLKHGKGWYEEQGAKRYAFRAFGNYLEADIEQVYIKAFEKKGAFGTDNPFDYDRFKWHALSLVDSVYISKEAYQGATDFLHSLTAQDVLHMCEGLKEQFPSVLSLQRILKGALEFLSHKRVFPQTLGGVLEELEKENTGHHDIHTPVHQILCDFRAEIVSNRNSIALPMIMESFLREHSSTRKAALASLILFEFLDIAEEVPDCGTTKKAQSVVYDCLFGDQETQQKLHKWSDAYLQKFLESCFEEVTTAPEIGSSFCKVRAHSTLAQMQQGFLDAYSRGITNFMDVLKPVLDWVGNCPLSDFQRLVPDFFIHCRMLEPSANLTIKQALMQIEQSTNREECESVIRTLLQSSAKIFSEYASASFLRYRQNPELFSKPREYELWMMAKCIVHRSKIFGLVDRE